MQITMGFIVDSVVSAADNRQQIVKCRQYEDPYVNPDYRDCVLTLTVTNDEELKRWGPGAAFRATLEI